MTPHVLKIVFYVLLAIAGIFLGRFVGRQCAWQATYRSTAVNNFLLGIVIMAGVSSRLILQQWDLQGFVVCAIIIGIPGLYQVNRTELNRPDLAETDGDLS